MNRGRGITAHKGGYTITETLIFLAVSAAIFAGAAVLINGRQGKVQFNNAVRQLESQIIDIANDVGNGYYEANPNLVCSVHGSGAAARPNPSVPLLGGERGTNKDCIFIGRTIALNNPSDNYNVYTMIGLRQKDGNPDGQPAKNLADTHPQTFDGFGLGKEQFIEAGATACIKVVGVSSSCNNTTSISFVSRLNGSLLESTSSGGSGIVADMYYSEFGLPLSSDNINAGLNLDSAHKNREIQICLNSGSSNQHAIITIKGTSSVSVTSQIGEGPASC